MWLVSVVVAIIIGSKTCRLADGYKMKKQGLIFSRETVGILDKKTPCFRAFKLCNYLKIRLLYDKLFS